MNRGTARSARTPRWLLIVLVLVTCTVLGGIGWAIWPKQQPVVPLHLTAGTVQADLLTPDQVSKLAQTTVVSGPRSDLAPVAIAASPKQCAVAIGPATESVYGHAWTAFLSATYTDQQDTGSYTVDQVIGVFPDSATAATAFKTLTAGLTQCKSSTRTDQAGRTTKWTYTSEPATSVAAVWTATQTDGSGWACYHQARLKGSSLIQVAICEGGDGQPTVSKVADALAGTVS